LLDVLQNFSDYNLPIDTIFSDIDYLGDFYANFEVSKDFYPEDIRAIKEKYGCNWVPIVDIGIKT
jgi:alpha-glucosidase (family GH31 glycosyl hydrolase)